MKETYIGIDIWRDRERERYREQRELKEDLQKKSNCQSSIGSNFVLYIATV